RAVAELTVFVISPAPHPTRGVERAGVQRAGRDLHHAAQPGDVHRDRGIEEPAVAQRAMGVAAPAPHAPRLVERAGVIAAGGELDNGTAGPAHALLAELHGRELAIPAAHVAGIV